MYPDFLTNCLTQESVGMESVSHLASRFVGEGNCQEIFGWYIVVPDQICYSIRDHTGFATARPGQYQRRPLVVIHGFSLLIVQFSFNIHRL